MVPWLHNAVRWRVQVSVIVPMQAIVVACLCKVKDGKRLRKPAPWASVSPEGEGRRVAAMCSVRYRTSLSVTAAWPFG